MKVLNFKIYNRFESGPIVIEATVKKDDGDVINYSIDEINSPKFSSKLLQAIFNQTLVNVLKITKNEDNLRAKEKEENTNLNSDSEKNDDNISLVKPKLPNTNVTKINPETIIGQIEETHTSHDFYQDVKNEEKPEKIDNWSEDLTKLDFSKANNSSTDEGKKFNGIELDPDNPSGLLPDESSESEDYEDNYGNED